MSRAATHVILRALRPTRGKLLVLLGLALVACGLYWWYDGGRWRFSPRHFGVVEPGVIYRSGRIHPALIEAVVEEHGLRVIVDLAAGGAEDAARRAEREVARRHGVRLVALTGLDGGGVGDLEDYVTVLTEMARARRERTPLLVHCAAGTERTGAAVAWFRMLFDDWSGERAYDEYLAYRYDRPGRDRLLRYMNENAARLVARLVETHALERPPESIPVFGPRAHAAPAGG